MKRSVPALAFYRGRARSLPLPATLSVGFAQLPACLLALCRCPLSLSHAALTVRGGGDSL